MTLDRRPGSAVVDLVKEDSRFQQAEALKRNRNKRHAQREFFVEGVRNLTQAAAHHWQFRALFFDRDAALSSWARQLRRQVRATTEFACAPRIMARLSDKDDPSELCAVVAMPDDTIDRIPISSTMRLVVLDRPQNPGNVGTILRTCDAFGIDGVVITGHAVDVYDPAVIRASMGSLFSVPAVRLTSPQEVLPWIERAGLRMVGTSAHGDRSIRDGELTAPIALVFGNETDGLSRAWRQACETVVRIPMTGTASSLNITSAVAIVLYQQSVA